MRRDMLICGTLFFKALILILLFTGNGVPLTLEKSKACRVPIHYPRIQEAVDATKPGDTIFVEPSIYKEHLTINKPITLVGADPATTIIDGEGEGHVIVVSSDNVIIKGFTIRNSGSPLYAGVYLYQVNNVSLMNNVITNCSVGIKTYLSNDVQIKNNQIINNLDFGIYIKHFSTRNLVCENRIAHNFYGVGLLPYSSENRIYNNSIVDNKYGIYITYSKNNIIELNNIAHNSLYGINFEGLEGGLTVNNAVIKNNLTENACGIFMSLIVNDNKMSNTIYQNNFINNTLYQAFVEPPFFSENIWNLPYPLGGNYWSDYQFDDLFHGVYQNISGADGIGDKAYVIAENNIDQYPVIHQIVWQNEPELQGGVPYYQFVTAFILVIFVGVVTYLILKKQVSHTKSRKFLEPLGWKIGRDDLISYHARACRTDYKTCLIVNCFQNLFALMFSQVFKVSID